MFGKNCIEFLKITKGCIINIASISGLRASTLRVAYGTSKAAIVHLTQQQASELGEFGIRVNCVSPGPVKTKLAMAVHTKDIIDAYQELSYWNNSPDTLNYVYFHLYQNAFQPDSYYDKLQKENGETILDKSV